MRTVFNTLFILINAVIVAFFSLFWVGSYERKIELYTLLPYSFIFRFLGVSAIGFIGIIILLILNFFLDKLFSKDIKISVFKKLGFKSLIITTLIAFLGTVLFFCV
ncbi:hypothetical protein ASE21_08805 [Flavobacterium sp. Root901]|nr:hypothetical protein ASE21_08805 [Flavobacterium sp. Root901]